jgi:hypothetical protein
MWTLHRFARLVKKLRSVQRSSGVGYKTPQDGQAAHTLEVEVDKAIAWVENNPVPFKREKGPDVR